MSVAPGLPLVIVGIATRSNQRRLVFRPVTPVCDDGGDGIRSASPWKLSGPKRDMHDASEWRARQLSRPPDMKYPRGRDQKGLEKYSRQKELGRSENAVLFRPGHDVAVVRRNARFPVYRCSRPFCVTCVVVVEKREVFFLIYWFVFFLFLFFFFCSMELAGVE